MPQMAQKHFPPQGHLLYSSDEQVTRLLPAAGFTNISYHVKAPLPARTSRAGDALTTARTNSNHKHRASPIPTRSSTRSRLIGRRSDKWAGLVQLAHIRTIRLRSRQRLTTQPDAHSRRRESLAAAPMSAYFL